MMKKLLPLIMAAAILMGTLTSASATGWVAKCANGRNSVKSLKVDSSGNTIVLSERDAKIQLLKYNNLGVLSWITNYSGLDGHDSPYDMSLDSSDNIYVTGSSYRSGQKDIVTLKYNSAGALQWVKLYNGAANQDDIGKAIKVDAAGNVYIAGTVTRTEADIIALKYDTNGNQQWVQPYGNAGNGEDSVSGLALDSSNNVFVGGAVYRGATNDYDYAVIKFANATGAISGVAFYNGRGVQSTDSISAITIDSSDNVIVTGGSQEQAGTFDSDYVTIKYNNALVVQWTKRYSGGPYDTASHIFSSADGSIVVTGASDSAATETDWATIKYNSSGVQQWVKRTRTAGTDNPLGLFVDSSYNVYVTGFVTGTTSGGTTGQDAFTVKYNSAGTPTFSARYKASTSVRDTGAAIAVFGGEIYVAIESRIDAFATDIVTIKYTP